MSNSPITEQKQEKTFTFVDDFDFGENPSTCETRITILDTTSNNSPVYNITYEHKIIMSDKSFIIENASQVKKPCPFAFYSKNMTGCYNGAIVIKNEMTTSMIKLMMMEDDELSNFTGCTTPQQYRRNILVFITQFWD